MTKPVQQTLDIFELPGLTNPNKRDLAKRSYDAGYQLGKSTQGFSIRLQVHSHESGGVSNIWPITNLEKRTDSAASYFMNEE